jgi:cell division septum initiation protein DivIVA
VGRLPTEVDQLRTENEALVRRIKVLERELAEARRAEPTPKPAKRSAKRTKASA